MRTPQEIKRQLEVAQDALNTNLDSPDVNYFNLFDAQGFFVDCEPKLDAKSLTAIHVNTLPDQHLQGFIKSLHDHLNEYGLRTMLDKGQRQQLNEFLKHVNQQEFLGALKTHYQSDSSAVINLERAMRFKLTQVAQSVLAACPGKKEDIERCYQDTLESYLRKTKYLFVFALIHAYENGEISIKKLNDYLDKQRIDVKNEMLHTFNAKLAKSEVQVNVPKREFQHTLDTTPAFSDMEIIEYKSDKVRALHTSPTTSHDEDLEKLAGVPVDQYQYQGGNLTPQFQQVRLPLFIPKTKVAKDKLPPAIQSNHQRITEKQIELGVQRLSTICNTYFNENSEKPIFQNLLTSYHYLELAEGDNEQTVRAKILPDIQDTMNQQRVRDGKVGLYFPYLTPVNGFGVDIHSSKWSSDVQNLALRNQMALLMQLGTDEQKEKLLELYKNHLKTNNRELSEGLKNFIVNTTLEFSAQDTAKTKLLKLIFNYELSGDKDYVKLASALFCSNVEGGRLIFGCKSGNERTAMTLYRQECIDELLGDCEKIPHEEEADKQFLLAFSQTLDDKVNQTNINGFSQYISLNDQGAEAKIKAKSGLAGLYNTNYAESKSVSNTKTSHVDDLQAHKDKAVAKLLVNEPSKRFMLKLVEGICEHYKKILFFGAALAIAGACIFLPQLMLASFTALGVSLLVAGGVAWLATACAKAFQAPKNIENLNRVSPAPAP
jgi:hypothetical protein